MIDTTTTMHELDGDRPALHGVILALAEREGINYSQAVDRFALWADAAQRRLERTDSPEAARERRTGITLARVLREGGIDTTMILSRSASGAPSRPTDRLGRVLFEGDWTTLGSDAERRAGWTRALAAGGWPAGEEAFHQARSDWALDGFDLLATLEQRRSPETPTFYGKVRRQPIAPDAA